jgi:hypothetical protein
MNRLAKAFVLAVASLATVFATASTASADHRGWRHHHGSNGDALAAGVIGLAAGAIIGGAIAESRANDRVYYVDPPRYRPNYYEQRPVYYPPAPRYYEPAPVYRAPRYSRPVVYGGYEPWSRGWYDYCSSRYRSFNPSTGTYRGYDGRDHFCTAN